MKRKLGILGLGMIIGLALMLAGWKALAGSYTYQGSLIDPPVPAPDISLTDQNGGTFKLSDQAGKVVLIFFGYTNCQDVCPTTMSEFKRIKQDLGDLSENIRFVLITVDPERDTVQQLKNYMASFDPSFIGLTGDPSALEAVWKSYGVYRQKQNTGSASSYEMDHSSYIYAIDPAGNWRLTYAFGMQPDKIEADVRHLMAEK